MAKDVLGLEWHKDPDEPLYNAMIWALSIGIIIVIVTLFLTRPAPESFSELYFNNHTSLPEFVQLNNSYPYSFSIHNLENTNTTYNYTVSEEYYILDYSCEAPEIWLNTETNDPALYIKDTTYTVGFDYEIKRGNKVSVSIVTPNNETLYILYIERNKITLNNQVFEIPQQNTNKFKMQVNSLDTVITLNDYTYQFPTPKRYTHGYINFNTYNTYAEFTNAYIEKSLKYPIYIRIPDAQYTEYDLKNETGRYYTDQPINLTEYTVKTSFRLNAVSLDLADVKIRAENNTVTITDNKTVQTYTITPQPINVITAKVNSTKINIYYNDEYVANINNPNTLITPQITYNNATINDFYVKSDESPVTIKYNIPEPREVTSQLLTVNNLKYMSETPDYNPTFNNITAGLKDNVEIQDLIEQEKITADDYRISTTYVDRNGILKIAMADANKNIYSVIIHNGTARIQYLNSSLQMIDTNVTVLRTNRVYIDARNNTLSVYFNNRRIFNQKAVTTNGILLFDYENLTITNAQLQDRKTGRLTTYRKQQSDCTPILLNRYIYNNNIFIPDKGLATLNDTAIFTQPFDIAKVQVSLNNSQEIHYWVKLI
jgi:hypothetical protein